MAVRTRVAPSPTGDPHVGTAYVALVNYCFAKKHGGEFILRIEDTDQQRSTAESERTILDALHWCGLAWDEGPDVGGPHGPYRQSERSSIYREYAAALLAKGDAFKCFCTPQRLEEMRVAQRAAGQPSRYDGRCLTLTPEEIARRESAGEPYVVRLRVPESGLASSRISGADPIEFDWHSVDMQVLMKSDGLPTYHLANVVDDHLMEITHVIRGEEWISSAPKHLLLYQYFGWEPPKFVHLPLLRNPDKSKLSKRKNPTGILFYRSMGYLPEALLNFLGLIANATHEDEEELIDLAGLVKRFELEHIPIGGPVFDVPKLDWLNGRYIRERIDPAIVRPSRPGVGGLAGAPGAHRRAGRAAYRAAERSRAAAFVSVRGSFAARAESFAGSKLDELAMRQAFTLALGEFDALPAWNVVCIENAFKRVAGALGKKVRDAARPFYVAITGSATSIPLYDSMELLGRDIVRERLRNALEILGAPSKREQEEWKTMLAAAEVAV